MPPRNSCVVQQQAKQEIDNSAGNDDQLQLTLRSKAATLPAPTGQEPWPFLVVGTANFGLFARDNTTSTANRLGNTANHSLVYASCQTTSDFTPGDVTGPSAVGPRWVKVHWKDRGGGKTQGLSEPGEPQTAWMYRGLMEPIGHNGDIPAC